MDIWPPPPERTEPNTLEGRQPPNTTVAIALGIPAGVLGGVLISAAVWFIKSALDSHSMSFKLPGVFYSLALLIEAGLGYVLSPKNKAFAVASLIAAACVSSVLGIFGTIIDGFSQFD